MASPTATRAQIFNIHTAKMRAEGLLGECVDVRQLADTTVNYSGAEIKGMVGAAQSHALSRYLRATEGEDYSGAGAASDDESTAAASSTRADDGRFRHGGERGSSRDGRGRRGARGASSARHALFVRDGRVGTFAA